MATIQIQIDDDEKMEADSLFRDYGFDTETALKVFISTVLELRSITFAIADADKTTDLEKIREKRMAALGSLKGKIWVSDDFDEPLEEMKEYME